MSFAPIIGIDGEGYGDGDKHRYRYFAAVHENGQVMAEARNLEGLTTRECLDALLELPRKHLIFGFSLGYDMTFWFRDIPAEIVYKLLRPEERQTKSGLLLPVTWWPEGSLTGYSLNLVQGRFDLTRVYKNRHKRDCRIVHWKSCKKSYCPGCRKTPCPGCEADARVRVWDIWKFFQSSFIKACVEWKVFEKGRFAQIEEFKLLRGTPEFERRWSEVETYCKFECLKLGELGRRLLRAHKDAGIPLRSYHGAGSTGDALLTVMKARDFMHNKVEKGEKGGKEVYEPIEYVLELVLAIAAAFFGGRFENSRRGPVRKPIHSADIASAYPYQFWQLPCLVHGKWELVRKNVIQAVEKAVTAVVHYRLPPCDALRLKARQEANQWGFNYQVSSESWGPYPFRHADGAITFPVTSGGGWVWKSEFLAGLQFAPNVEPIEAWVYSTACNCQVFKNQIPGYYKKRLEWGKDGPGVVMKLGLNSCPGKCAQSKGSRPKYQNFVWAGMVNAGTRAQLLRAMQTDRDAVISTATDGLLSIRPLGLEEPLDTNTKEAAHAKGKGALGEWEVGRVLESGVHLIRPGVLFPLDGSELKQTKARGVGKNNLHRMEQEIVRMWEEHGPKTLVLERPMFWGMRSCIRRHSDGTASRDAKHATWEKQPIEVSYNPRPKRPEVGDSSASGGERLLTWGFPVNLESEAYDPAKVPAHVRQLREDRDLMLDQPDSLEEDETLGKVGEP